METVQGDETGREGERVRTETQGEEREQKKGDKCCQMTQKHDSERLVPPLTIEISLLLWILAVICGMSAGLLGLLS